MRKVFFLALFVLGFAVPSVIAQDAVKVDPQHYTVEFENSRVRVLRAKYGPGEKSVMHSHPATVAVFQTDATGKFTFPNGKTQDINGKAGQVVWGPAVTHLPENTGSQAFEVIVIELKGKARARSKTMKKPGTSNTGAATPKP